jgi:hypothetical protein
MRHSKVFEMADTPDAPRRHDKIEAVLTDIKLSRDHDFDLPMAVQDALEKGADLIRSLRTECDNQATKIVELEEKDWRSFSTAPKDGRDILCFSGIPGMGQMVLAFWDGAWREKANCLALLDHALPSHWMSLPPAPESAALASIGRVK